MNKLLDGKQLIWAAYDPTQVVPTLTSQILKNRFADTPITTQFQNIEELGRHSDFLSGAEFKAELGLLLLRLQLSAELAIATSMIAEFRSQTPGPLCLVLLDNSLCDSASILCEAGAQLVVSQVPSLQRGLEAILNRDPLPIVISDRSSHPLLAGLIDRLPWPWLDDPED
ncbi:MAG: hypothetical protein AAF483_03960 [Planctomycetota bacterium]